MSGVFSMIKNPEMRSIFRKLGVRQITERNRLIHATFERQQIYQQNSQTESWFVERFGIRAPDQYNENVSEFI